MTLFLRLLSSGDKGANLREDIAEINAGALPPSTSEVDTPTLRNLPGAALIYWAPAAILAIFERLRPLRESGRKLRQGLATADDFRFVRAWWEVSGNSLGQWWHPFTKGGEQTEFLGDPLLVVNWAHDGAELKSNLNERGQVRSNVWMLKDTEKKFFFRAGLTWPSRPYKRGTFAVIAPGAIFSHTGTMIFGGDGDDLLSLCALFNSDTFIGLLHLLLPRGGEGSDRTLQYEVGYVSAVPVPELHEAAVKQLARDAEVLLMGANEVARHDETSHWFSGPSLLETSTDNGDQKTVADLGERSAARRRVNSFVAQLYGLDSANREFLVASANLRSSVDTSETAEEAVVDPNDDDDEADSTLSNEATSQAFAWAVGVVFGRFQENPAPFTPAPLVSMPLQSVVINHSRGHLRDIRVTDAGHVDDLVNAVSETLARAGLSIPQDKVEVLAADFFRAHLRKYSRMRRKAPIYWQLATPSANYSVWLYIHAFNKDTLFRVQNDYAVPKLAHEERRLDSLRIELRDGSTANQRKELTEQEAIVEELRGFLEEVKRVAPLWNPNLDDGVIINFAPLWRLVPQPRPWQKELKSTWQALCEAKYDWAHLAMHLWPERVVPKCAKDRSLAIAHGLEDVFWVESADGKWTARKIPTCSVDELVQERTSPAVKSALKSLLEASAATGNGGRGRGGRRRAAVATERGDA